MKVGDYVRTKRGLIARILKINSTGSITCDRNIYYGVGDYNSKKTLCDLTQIIRSSESIIDLIQEGDYVNGNLVSYIGSDCIEVYWYKDETQWLEQDDIKSIVTKEQFESMEYNLESKEK